MSPTCHYLRPVDFDALSGDEYRRQVLWASDSCSWTAVSLGPRAFSPPQRTCAVDQVFYVLEGELQLQMGEEQCAVSANSVAYIPAGVPHRCWNIGQTRELHLEVLAPGAVPGEDPWQPTDSTNGPGGAFVRSVSEVEIDPKVKIFDRRLLVTNADGAENIMLYEAVMKPGEGGMGLHIHKHADQFYYVLDGQLSCQIGIDTYTIGPHTLAVLLREMPHDPWNDSDATERHLNVITPGAVPNQPGAHVSVRVETVR